MHFGCRSKKSEDEEVLASFSVYFTPSLLHQTHIFQYPLRQRSRPYEANDIKLFSTNGIDSSVSSSNSRSGSKAVINPNSRLTMQCTLDTFNTTSFRQDRVDENRKSISDNAHTYSFTLQSKPFYFHSDYLIGYFYDGGLHLSPVSSIQHFLPALESKSNDGDSTSKSCGGPVRISQEHCSTQTTAAVSGLFASIRLQKELMRQRSVMINSDADTAVELKFHFSRSAENNDIKRKLICSTKERASSMSILKGKEARIEDSFYSPELCASGGIYEGENASPSIIRRFIASYTIFEQVSSLLKRCQVLTLEILRENLSEPNSTSLDNRVPEVTIIDSLKSTAVYMHGVWVCCFSECFKGSIAALREVILLQFQRSSDGSLRRSQLNDLVNTSSLRRSIKEILEKIAILNSAEPDPEKRRWRLRYVPEDRTEYSKRISSIEARFQCEIFSQRDLWANRTSQILNHLTYINLGQSPPSLLLINRFDINNNANNMNRGVAYNSAISNSATSVDNKNATEAFTEQDLVPIQRYIRILFAEHGVINKLRVKELVLKARESHYPTTTNQMLGAALQSQVQTFTSSTWVLKTLGEPSVDRHRPLIIAVLLELKIFETRAVLSKLNEIKKEYGESTSLDNSQPEQQGIPVQIVQRVISEVSEFKSGERLWHLKVGNVMVD
ncbi:unnamed protein product [Phytomonas sp. Hart1]|nr:unnamed protein product [Phytomonas sp. Hart1]|eukprot:CCW66765.1 unnamed protein product [Phytomonas sp. isolate Hart1]